MRRKPKRLAPPQNARRSAVKQRRERRFHTPSLIRHVTMTGKRDFKTGRRMCRSRSSLCTRGRPAPLRAPPRVVNLKVCCRERIVDWALFHIRAPPSSTKEPDLHAHASFQTASGTRSALFLWTARPNEVRGCEGRGDLPTKTPPRPYKPLADKDFGSQTQSRRHLQRRSSPLPGGGA